MKVEGLNSIGRARSGVRERRLGMDGGPVEETM